MIFKIKPDEQKAKALMAMAETTLKRLKDTDMEKYPTNTLTDYYDVIHKLMEAIALANGVKVKGEGAHKELIDYIAKQYDFNEQTRLFLQQIRDYRNRISYEGFMVHKNFIILNQAKINLIIKKLFAKLKL